MTSNPRRALRAVPLPPLAVWSASAQSHYPHPSTVRTPLFFFAFLFFATFAAGAFVCSFLPPFVRSFLPSFLSSFLHTTDTKQKDPKTPSYTLALSRRPDPRCCCGNLTDRPLNTNTSTLHLGGEGGRGSTKKLNAELVV